MTGYCHMAGHGLRAALAGSRIGMYQRKPARDKYLK